MENLNKNKVRNIGYEETDEKMEIYIYGIKFEINREKILEKDIKNIESDNLEKDIEDVLGTGAVEKINNKRVNDGYSKMTVDVALKILSYIYVRYVEITTNPVIDNYCNIVKKQQNRILNMYGKNQNREQKRKYRKEYNRRSYRRY